MNPRTYIPSLFIDIGSKGHFYTLRQTYLHAVPGDGQMGNASVNGVYQGSFEERSFHHFNLSQEAAEAIEKAVEASTELGVRFTAPTAEQLSGQLAAVHRATAEELAAREARYLAMREEYRLQREAEQLEKIEALQRGQITWGRHTGKHFSQVERQYLAWVVGKREAFESGSLMRVMADVIVEKYADLLPTRPKLSAFLGEEKQRLTIDVEVIRLGSYQRQKFGADWLTETVWITTMVTSTGECVVVKSPNFRADDGSCARIKATVKAHDYYGEQAQTILTRVEVVGDYGVDVAPVKKVRKAKVQDVLDQPLPF